jgi:uncharacterized iron-regulated membrane protein
MVTVIWAVSLIVSGLVVVDELRRPASEWTAADRNRGYWVGLTVTAGFLFLGVLAALVYAVALVPRFAMAQDSDSAFRKHAVPPTARTPMVTSAEAPLPSADRPAPLQPAEQSAESLPSVGRSSKLVIEFDDA